MIPHCESSLLSYRTSHPQFVKKNKKKIFIPPWWSEVYTECLWHWACRKVSHGIGLTSFNSKNLYYYQLSIIYCDSSSFCSISVHRNAQLSFLKESKGLHIEAILFNVIILNIENRGGGRHHAFIFFFLLNSHSLIDSLNL